MSNKDDNKGNNNKPRKATHSTGQIQDVLYKKIKQDEATLPDHLLHEHSREKRKRDNEKNYLLSLDAEIAQYQIKIMVKKAQLKYLEDEEYYKSLQRIDEKAIFYRNLLQQYLESERTAAKLSEAQMQRLMILQRNFDEVLRAVENKALLLREDITKLKIDLTALRNSIPDLTNRYSIAFGRSFIDAADFKTFTESKLNISQVYTVGLDRDWSIEVNADGFRQLGEAIARAIVHDKNISLANINLLISSETAKFIHNKITESLHTLPAEQRQKITNQLEKSSKIQNIIQTLVTQVHEHLQQSAELPQLHKMTAEYENIQAEIEKKEGILAELEKKVALLDKYREVLEAASDMNLGMAQEQKCAPQEFENVISSGIAVINDAIANCDLPLQEIKLEDDPFGEEEYHSPSPGLR